MITFGSDKFAACYSILASLRGSIILAWLAAMIPSVANAEDGYELWMRYHSVEAPWLDRYRSVAREIVAANPASPAVDELRRAIVGLLGIEPRAASRPTRDGAIVLGTPESSPVVAQM